MIKINPCNPPIFHQCHFSLSSNPLSVCLSVCLSLSLLILSLSVSPSLLSAAFPRIFYLPPFCLNTWLIQCLIIIDLNKLIWTTMLLHLEVAHNTTYQSVDKLISMTAMNLVKPKGGAKNELLLNKPASEFLVVYCRICQREWLVYNWVRFRVRLVR